MVLDGYVGPLPHQLAQEFVSGWRAFRDRYEEALQLPSLEDEVENQFIQLKAQIIHRSRILDIVTEGSWGMHGKIKNLIFNVQSLDHQRQESVIIQDSVRNQWHDIFIQTSKMVAVFHHEVEDEETVG